MTTRLPDTPRRTRLLMLAYACSPERGSEPAVGWNRALQAARFCDTVVICEGHINPQEIQRYWDVHGPVPGLSFEFVAKSRWVRLLGRVPSLYYLAYNLWQRKAYRVAARLHARERFDLVHHVTFGGYREPGYLWKLDIPFVWGPVGGAQNYPWRFLGVAGLRGASYEAIRSVANALQLRLARRVGLAARRAAAFLTANRTNQKALERAYGVQPTVFPANGIARLHGDAPSIRPAGEPLRILWCGRLEPLKGLSLLIEALARLAGDVPFELRVVGQGSAAGRWQRLSGRRGIDGRTTWLGEVPYQEALQQYAWADLFVLTTLRDTLPTVALEALGAGLPIVCLDHHGLGEVVTDDCGIRVLENPRQVIRGLEAAIRDLAADSARRECMGAAAAVRARDYLWSRQGQALASIYRDALAGASFDWSDRATSPVEKLPVVAPPPTVMPSRNGRGWLQRDALTNAAKWGAGIAAIGLTRLLGSRDNGAPGILVYHRVTPLVAGIPKPTINVTPDRFRDQLVGLLNRGFTIWPLARLLDAHRRNAPIPARTIVLTFDDGYEGVYRYAWPVLRELNVPATVFVNTAFLDADILPFDPWAHRHRGNLPDSAYRPLSGTQCHEMLRGGLIEIGTHTHTHEDFRGRPDALRADLEASIGELRARFGLDEVSFAFPFGRPHLGYVTDALVAAARRTGVTCGLTTENALVDLRSDPFSWGRFNAFDFDTSATLAAKLDGWYGWAADVQEWVA